jgi:CubicO group peptidase (beta-lactamase class C family)
MHLAEGSFDGKRILSRNAVIEMHTKQTGKLPNQYGLGWTIEEAGQRFSHGGAYGTEIWVDTARSLVGAVFTQMPVAQAKPFIQQVRTAIEQRFDAVAAG